MLILFLSYNRIASFVLCIFLKGKNIVEVDGSAAACACVTFNVTWNSTNTNSEVTGGWSAVGFGGDRFVPDLNCNNP